MGYLTGRPASFRAETPDEALQRAMSGGGSGAPTRSGVRVTPATAMRISTVWACVQAASQDVAKLPLILYRRTRGGGKERATDHPLYHLAHDRPNGLQTSFDFRRTMQAHRELGGNAYALKVRVRGQVKELLPIHPSRVTVSRRGDWERVYKVGSATYTRAEMFHLSGLSLDGLTGLSPIGEHRESVGLALAMLEHGAKLFTNFARPSGVLEAPTELSDAAAARMKKSWNERQGGDNIGSVALLEGGTKFSPMSLSMEDAQYLESRQFQRSEIASIYRMPPHKIGDLTKSTNNNIEHQALEYVGDSLVPRLVEWEQMLNAELLTPAEQEVYFFEFLVDGLLRGDQKSRNEAYAMAVLNGWMSRNEVRVRENMNPVEGLDEYRVPLNTERAGLPAPQQ